MKLVSFADDRIGILTGPEHLVDATEALRVAASSWPPTAMVQAIAAFPTLRDELKRTLDDLPVHRIDEVRLNTPVAWPNKVIAFPANYQAHIDEMSSRNRADINGFFLKANSSLVGPHDEIVLPDLPGFEVHHECELALVIGKTGRHVPESEAMQHVFGYSCLIDATVRGPQERVMRKSYDTFTPVGPYLVTADDVPDPHNLDLELWVDDERRQHANTRNLLLGLREMISLASSVATLLPGDIIATGTPQGVGPMYAGQAVRIAIQDVGTMTLPVVQGSGGGNRAFEGRSR